MTDVLKLLSRASFRGLEFPISNSADVSFSHDGVQHKLEYRDNAIVEALGARNLTFSYTIPWREDIQKGTYKNLFSVGLPFFIEAIRDQSPGLLVDPLWGEWRVQPTQGSTSMTPQARDGADMRVEFIHAPELEEDPEFEAFDTVEAIQNEAGNIDAEVALIDWKQEESPEPALDPLKAIQAVGDQANRIGNKTNAAFNDAAYRLERVEGSIDRLEDPKLWGLRSSSRRLRGAITRSKSRVEDPGRVVRVVANRYARTASAVALELGLTLAELIRLNPKIAKTPLVPLNQLIRFYAQ